ncbi:MAG: cytochrome b5-like heme/steroid binding domain-containing protein [Candidatus Staskawiczbacteria bacterium]|jgi:cytochrome b involved in lipid metabolism
MRKIIIVSLAVFWLAVLGIFGSGLMLKTEIQSVSSNTTSAMDASTLSEQIVSTHNKQNDCWMIISGKVYDFTEYLPIHPGGAETVISYCGKDATVAFLTKDQNPGKPHSEYAQSLFDQYYVGELGLKKPVVSLADPSSNNPGVPAKINTESPSTTSPGYTSAQVAAHNSAGSCWVIIGSKVYNVTNYIPSHPGGVGAILPYCGKDGTAAFTGLPHSQSAVNLLASYFVGNFGSSTMPPPPPIIPPRDEQDDDDD